MLNVCSPSVDAETMHHRKGPAAGMSESAAARYKPNKSVPTMKTSTDERESMNCCYGYTNAEGYSVLCCFFSTFGL